MSSRTPSPPDAGPLDDPRAVGRRVRGRVRAVGRVSLVLSVLAVVFWGFVTWHAQEMQLPRAQYGVIVLGAAITFYTLENGLDAYESGDQLVRLVTLVAALVVGVVATGYVVHNYETLQHVRIGYNTEVDYAVAAAFLATILYLTYDAYGGLFAGVILAVVLYGQFGPAFPGFLQHGGLSPEQGLQFGMLDVQGVYSSLTQVMGTVVAPFLLLAGLIRMYGGFALVVDLAIWVSKRTRSAIPQTAVVTSMIIGSINGSALANTAITGSFTIPLLKTSGLESEEAAAIESIASTGGQVMPPVMGVAAFLMSDILQRPLIDIFVAAVVPALTFYLVVMFSVFQITRSSSLSAVDLSAVSPDALPERREWFDADTPRSGLSRAAEVGQFVVPLVVLFYLLGVAQTSELRAALAASGAMVVTGVAYATVATLLDSPNLGLGAALVETALDTGKGLREGASTLAPLTIVVAAIGLLVDTLFATGLPGTLSFALIDLSGGVLWVLLVLTAILCIVLGMGAPTTAAYLVVAILIAPELIEFGISELPAHFFVLYFAVLAVITPPIAPGIVVASGIAEADFWRACLESLKIALPIFVLPFAFVYHPVLVTTDVGLQTVVSAALLVLGAGVLSVGLNSRPLFAGVRDALGSPVAAWGARAGVAIVGAGLMVRPF